jgi:glyoxylase-like metal-dependent hydrolase (beta-lactamase superfamily II)
MTWTRRDFVRTSALGAVASLLTRPSLVAQQPAAAPAAFTALRRNVGIFTERGGTIGWLVNGDGVLVVDSQFPDTAPNFLSGLKQRTPRQIDVLVNSHHHGDHTGGNTAFRSAARQIVAHARSLENQRAAAERSGAMVTLPDTTFTDAWSVEVGDETVRAKHYGPAHTGGDVAIVFERANIVHLGDLLNNHGFPNIDGPSGASVHGWIRVLETIAPEFPDDTLFIFGHNEPGFGNTGPRADLMFQRDYFSAVLDAAGRALKEGKSREETVTLEALPGFENLTGARARLGLALGMAYDELSKS